LAVRLMDLESKPLYALGAEQGTVRSVGGVIRRGRQRFLCSVATASQRLH
jgi:hypothetical protein